MDMIPGWKTKLTALVGVAFTLLTSFGLLEVTPEQSASITTGLVSLIGLFLAMKIDRQRGDD
jgi:hypothetical protein